MSPKFILAATALLLGIGTAPAAFAEPPSERHGTASRDVSAVQLNGTWRCGKDTFKILALGNGKLQVAFDGTHEYKSPYGPSANLGQAEGVASIVGDTAVFVPSGTEQDGKITLKFAHGKLIAVQMGTCAFGRGVYADGTYRKISSRKPKFGD